MKDAAKEVDQSDLIELDFLEALSKRLPDDAEVLKALGDLCTRVGRYEEGLDADRKLAKLCPDDSLVWYNLGCSLALLHRTKDALAALTRAVSLGYSDHEWMSRDADLRSLRDDRTFQSLLKKITACSMEPQDDTGSF